MNLSKDQINGLSAGGASIASGLGSLLFGDKQNPQENANQYLDKIPGTISPYFNPYIQQGQRQNQNLEGQYGQTQGELPGLQQQYGNMAGFGGDIMGHIRNLLSNPASIMNQIGAGYHQSPGYDWEQKQGTNAVNNAAAAGGMLGSPMHQQQAAEVTQGLANRDYNNYLSQALGQYGIGLNGASNLYGAGVAGQQGLYNRGLQGQEGLSNQGYSASDSLAGALANLLQNQGSLAYQSAANENQSEGDTFGQLFGGAAAIAPYFLA